MLATSAFTRPCVRPGLQRRIARPVVVCADSNVEKSWPDKLGTVVAAVSVACMLSLGTPDDAMAAKSAGRAGGSSFSSARATSPAPRRAPPPAATASPSISINTYTPSPFGFSPFGFSPFGFSPFGFGYGAPVVVGAPVFGLGSVFSLMFSLIMLTILFQVVSGVLSGFNKKKEDNDGW